MKRKNTGAVLVALGLSLAVFAQPPTVLVSAGGIQNAPQDDRAGAVVRILSLTATAGDDGVLIEWRTAFELNNVGFNLYREQAGRRVRVNASLIPGSVLIAGEGTALRGGYGYSAFDRGGTLDAKYYLESADLHGGVIAQGQVAPVARAAGSKFRNPLAESGADNGGEDGSERYWPAGFNELIVATGSLEDQWAIAAQPALKIGVRQDGWYRLTQAQLSTAGLDPAIDAGNLRLFVAAQEIPIRVSRTSGPLVPGDFIEFYGTALDLTWTGTQMYWLMGGTQPGKRIPVLGEVSHDVAPAKPVGPLAQPLRPAGPDSGPGLFVWPGPWAPEAIRGDQPRRVELKPSTAPTYETQAPGDQIGSPGVSGAGYENRARPIAEDNPAVAEPAAGKTPAGAELPAAKPSNASTPKTRAVPGKTLAAAANRSKNRKRKRKARKSSHRLTVKRNHAVATAAAPPSFLQVVERQDRHVYYSSLQNGEPENFFGQVFSAPNSLTQTLTLKNVDTSAEAPAQLQVALQGVSTSEHRVNVFFNDVLLGVIVFYFNGHPVQTFPVPVALLREGGNDVRLAPQSGSGTNLVDYLRLTYSRSYRAENNALRFTGRFDRPIKVDGFTAANVRVYDLSDPLAVTEVRPIVETSMSGYAITVPATGARRKGPRLLLAFAGDQFLQPASVTMNAPSSLNAHSTGADMVIITPGDFGSSAEQLAALRRSQGLSVATVNVADIFDEFSYGLHSPYAVKDFLSRAATTWPVHPRYVLLLGDGSYDPRDYQGVGNFDLVPTKLIDTFYTETASDDWLADFDNDGVPELSVGRLPARNVTEANIMVSKVVNFLPANVPQSALLVADTQGSYYFNFEAANAEVAALLPPSMAVQTVNRRTEPSDAAATANILSKFNAGQILVNYSGHGNVNAWAGNIFTSAHAIALTNGNKLPFAVVMDCLNGYFIEPRPLGEGLAESLLKAPNGGAVAAFASSGLTLPDGQHEMSEQLFTLVYSGPPMPLGDAVRQAKNATFDIDVRRTWIFFGDPSMKIR